MKIRNIPFGYRYENGGILINTTEADILHGIFKDYLNGQSLLKIAKQLTERSIEYMPGVIGWNKARIMRLIEDKRYIGTDIYPAIIDESTRLAMITLKDEKNNAKNTDFDQDIFKLSQPVLCPECGSPMRRRNDNRSKCKQRWACQNSSCKKLITIADEELLSGIVECLNRVIAKTAIIHCDTTDEPEPDIEVRRLEREIAQAINGFQADKESIRKKLFECVSLKYKGIKSDGIVAWRLKAELEKSNPLSVFSEELCNRAVQSIRLGSDRSVSIILINGQMIGKEQA